MLRRHVREAPPIKFRSLLDYMGFVAPEHLRPRRCMMPGVFLFDSSIFTACSRVLPVTATQTAGVLLSVHDYRAFRAVQAALKTAAAAVSTSHEFVSCVNGGNSDVVLYRYLVPGT